MTRRELREHCFKMLFGTAFYPIEEADDQISHYFEAPDEDEQQEDGSYRVIHSAAFDIYDSDYVRGKVEKIIEKIPELDERINGVAEGWKTKRMGRVELAILRLALYEISFDDDIPETVSYTHLDVYNRQSWCGATEPSGRRTEVSFINKSAMDISPFFRFFKI